MLQQGNAIDALLAEYVSGALPAPLQVLLASHLEMNDSNREWLENLDAMAGLELSAIQPVRLSNRDKMLAAVFSEEASPTDLTNMVSGDGTPAILREFIGSDVSEIPWKKSRFVGFQEFKLGEVDGCKSSVFRLPAGQGVPHHTHHGTEITLVIKGAFEDGTGMYRAGDISIADDSVDHRPVATDDMDCICFAVTDAPLRLTGPLGRFISPFIRT